ncbi:MAG: dephospho-CoA kinase [Oscillospiraceae bacterium]
MILGITGGSGCGKTTALKAVQDLGGLVLDCDAIYHELLACSPALLAAIGARFPGAVSGSELDRKKLGRLVFSDEKALLDLNRITHRAVKEEVPGPSGAQHIPLAAIDAIALFEGGLAELCQYTVAITAPWEDRISGLWPGKAFPGLRRGPASGPARQPLLPKSLRLHPGKLRNQGCVLRKGPGAVCSAPRPRCPSPCESQTNYI